MDIQRGREAIGTAKVIITAGARGLGRAMAERFIADGAAVHICDIDGGALERALRDVPRLQGAVANIGDPSTVRDYLRTAVGALGGVDVLINNAGIAGPRGPVETLDTEAWDLCVRVNLSGAFYAIREIVPVMKVAGAGAIINVSTVSVRTGLPHRAAYVAAKAGLEGLTKTLARELGPSNIRVNAIQPGLVDNERARTIVAGLAAERGVAVAEMERSFLDHISMRSWIQPSEVADTVAFLASPAARHISGQIIGVCGNFEWES